MKKEFSIHECNLRINESGKYNFSTKIMMMEMRFTGKKRTCKRGLSEITLSS
jgi:hypothetical protein